MEVFVPVVDVRNGHGSGGDGHSFVGVPVDDVDVLVALRREDHGKLTTIFSKHLQESVTTKIKI